MSVSNLHSLSIKARPSCFAYKAPFLQQACNIIVWGNLICLQALNIYVICHHLVCQWLNLLGLHFLVFTPTRAQAPGWLYNLWHTFRGITNIQVATCLSYTFYQYKLHYKWGWSIKCVPLFVCLGISFSSCHVVNCGQATLPQIVVVVTLLTWSSQVFLESHVR